MFFTEETTAGLVAAVVAAHRYLASEQCVYDRMAVERAIAWAIAHGIATGLFAHNGGSNEEI